MDPFPRSRHADAAAALDRPETASGFERRAVHVADKASLAYPPCRRTARH